jgi:hypothetical protein
MALCSGERADGRPCKAQAIADGQWCFNHHPEYELARRRRASKGGKRGGRGRTHPGTADLARLQRHFESLADNVLAGEVDRAEAAVAIQAWNGARACIAASAKLRELEDIEARLDALEGAKGAV